MRILIIGGVAAGMSAAAKLKRVHPDYDVVVYEKSDIVSFGACGLPYFVGGFFEDHNNMLARTPEQLIESGIDLRLFHEVISVDVDNKKLRIKDIKSNTIIEDNYDKLMIATGASSVIPPIKNVNLKNVTTLKTMEDGIRLRELFSEQENESIVVIGAGFIGVEIVEAARKLGKKVTLVEAGNQILGQAFDKEITEVLEEHIKSHEVEVRKEEFVTELVGEDTVKEVITSKGRIPADVVIIATGVRPNTSFLKDTQIEMMSNGAIVINEYGETSVKDIYAAGDCASIQHMVTKKNVYVPLATGANKLGRIVGENLGGERIAFPGSLGSSCIKVMDLEAASTGLTKVQAEQSGFDVKESFISDYNQANYYPGRNKMYVKLIYDANTKVILGGQVVGYKDAVQRTNVLAAAIYGGMTTTQLGMLDLCYAPPFARTWDILNVAGNVSK